VSIAGLRHRPTLYYPTTSIGHNVTLSRSRRCATASSWTTSHRATPTSRTDRRRGTTIQSHFVTAAEPSCCSSRRAHPDRQDRQHRRRELRDRPPRRGRRGQDHRRVLRIEAGNRIIKDIPTARGGLGGPQCADRGLHRQPPGAGVSSRPQALEYRGYDPRRGVLGTWWRLRIQKAKGMSGAGEAAPARVRHHRHRAHALATHGGLGRERAPLHGLRGRMASSTTHHRELPGAARALLAMAQVHLRDDTETLVHLIESTIRRAVVAVRKPSASKGSYASPSCTRSPGTVVGGQREPLCGSVARRVVWPRT